MKKVLICIIIYAALSAYGQTPAIKLALHQRPEDARTGDKADQRLYAGNKDEFIASDKTKYGEFFTSYSSVTMKPTGTFKVEDLEIDGKNTTCIKRIFHRDKITSLYNFTDKYSKENRIYGVITDRQNNIVKKEIILIKNAIDRPEYSETYAMVYSDDNNKILIYKLPKAYSYDNEKIQMVSYDIDLNILFSKSLFFPSKDKAFFVSKVLLTNSGKVVIVTSMDTHVNTDTIKSNMDKIMQLSGANYTYTYKVFGLEKKSSVFIKIELPETEYKLTCKEGYVKNDSSGEIILSGLYTDRIDGKSECCLPRGMYYFRLNANSWKIDLIKYNKISPTSLNAFYEIRTKLMKGEKEALEKTIRDMGISKIRFDDYFWGADGSLKIICQVLYNYATDYTQNKSNYTFIHSGFKRLSDPYGFGRNMNILEFSLDSNGELSDPLVILKDQWECFFNHHVGNLNLIRGDKIFYVFNDDEGNYDAETLAKNGNNNYAFCFASYKRKNRLCYVTVDDNNDVSKLPLMDSWKGNVLVYPYFSVRMNDGSIISWGQMDNDGYLILVKVYLKD